MASNSSFRSHQGFKKIYRDKEEQPIRIIHADGAEEMRTQKDMKSRDETTWEYRLNQWCYQLGSSYWKMAQS